MGKKLNSSDVQAELAALREELKKMREETAALMSGATEPGKDGNSFQKACEDFCAADPKHGGRYCEFYDPRSGQPLGKYIRGQELRPVGVYIRGVGHFVGANLKEVVENVKAGKLAS